MTFSGWGTGVDPEQLIPFILIFSMREDPTAGGGLSHPGAAARDPGSGKTGGAPRSMGLAKAASQIRF